MQKSKEELQKLKEELKTLTSKLSELDEDELKEVVGGYDKPIFETGINIWDIDVKLK